jgi:hypothetical protein
MEPPLNMNLLRWIGSQGTIEVVPDELPICRILPLLKIIFIVVHQTIQPFQPLV